MQGPSARLCRLHRSRRSGMAEGRGRSSLGWSVVSGRGCQMTRFTTRTGIVIVSSFSDLCVHGIHGDRFDSMRLSTTSDMSQRHRRKHTGPAGLEEPGRRALGAPFRRDSQLDRSFRLRMPSFCVLYVMLFTALDSLGLLV